MDDEDDEIIYAADAENDELFQDHHNEEMEHDNETRK